MIRPATGFRGAVLTLLAIEVLDELVFGAREAAWPRMREELDLSYSQIGLLLSIPFYSSAVLEPVFGILGDSRWRRAVVFGGGIGTAVALALVAAAPGFAVLLVAFALLFPADGAFVSLSQATLMDLEPDRREQNMTRWGMTGARQPGERRRASEHRRSRSPGSSRRDSGGGSCSRSSPSALRRPRVVRWLALLEFADLMLDILLGFVALYLVDEIGASAAVGSLGVAVWTGAGLAGGFGVIALLRRVDGLRYLRASAVAALGLYPLFLFVPGLAAKLAVLALLGLATAGWYSIPKARLYDSLSGQSGAAMALGSIAGLVGGTFPLAIGVVAQRYGLDAALWLLLAGPLALLVGVPRRA